MGIYFEPPPRRATKQWQIMQLLAENGYRFYTEGGKTYIKAFVLQTKRPRIADVCKRVSKLPPKCHNLTVYSV
ncbi:hypothetical protein UH38_14430 [Aliterella atlantica CENA595]|uniref:Uncharacterized protein n=2 Tax=Aliterella TaxID=1827277 RepID=A0A0D8ZQY8_9CYAN|nr:hypothetical protein UH38_14430 [Aliterella atlantica CENA595]